MGEPRLSCGEQQAAEEIEYCICKNGRGRQPVSKVWRLGDLNLMRNNLELYI